MMNYKHLFAEWILLIVHESLHLGYQHVRHCVTHSEWAGIH